MSDDAALIADLEAAGISGDLLNRVQARLRMEASFRRRRAAFGSGGRPPATDWNAVNERLRGVMDQRGEFGHSLPAWQTPAALYRELLQFCLDAFAQNVGYTTMRENAEPMLAAWRRGEAWSAE